MKVEKDSPAKLRRRREVGLVLQSWVEHYTLRAIEEKIVARIPLEPWEKDFLDMVPAAAG